MIIEIIKFIIYSILIVVISKYVLVTTLRKLAESLNLKAKTVGDIAGLATSVPEFLTITTSSLRGLYGTSIYNILSSNVINLLQYIGAIILNRNFEKLRNKAIKSDLIIVIITIVIPILLIKFDIELNILIVPAFIILYSLFKFINNNAHKLYLKKEDEKIEQEIQKEIELDRKNKVKIFKYWIILFFTGIILFIIGEFLGDTLENLCNLFNVSEVVIGILLGIITSLPELITFFEAQKYHKNEENAMQGVVEATNNLLTSNMLNLFIIQSIGVIIITILYNI